LSENYDVYLVDLLGIGRSSWPKFTANTSESAESFYLDAFEEWW